MSNLLELLVSNSDLLPQMDPAQTYGKTYDSLNELMRAIILRTIDDYNSGGILREEALEYMDSEEEEYIFCFHHICKHLGLDPLKTRFSITNAKTKISTRRRAA